MVFIRFCGGPEGKGVRRRVDGDSCTEVSPGVPFKKTGVRLGAIGDEREESEGNGGNGGRVGNSGGEGGRDALLDGVCPRAVVLLDGIE